MSGQPEHQHENGLSARGEVPPDWRLLTFEEYAAPPHHAKASVLQRDYRSRGRFPVVDQGVGLVAGYTDDESLVYAGPLPVIVFGDHTRALKLVDFPFATGAEGTKLLVARPEVVDPAFLYYALRAVPLESRGYNRHFNLLREKVIAAPKDLREQRAIAGVLAKVQRAAGVEDRRITALKELKAATMAKVFREGLRGGPLKQTEIGQIPRTWDVITLGSGLRTAQYGLSVRGEKTGRVPILRMNCQQDGRVVFRDLQYVDLDEPTIQRFRLQDGDLLFNRTNSFELVGRTALFSGNREAVFASYLIRLQVQAEMLVPDFLNYYLNLESVQRAIKSLATRGVSQSNISASKLRTFLVPKPSLPEQWEITNAIETIARSLEPCEQRREVLDPLFQSTLQRLITGQLRVTSLLEGEEASHA